MIWLCSNRSAALLQLKKSGKALEDAEQCIKLRPDWDKGFYRRGLALELADRYPEVTSLIFATSSSLPCLIPKLLRLLLILNMEKLWCCAGPRRSRESAGMQP